MFWIIGKGYCVLLHERIVHACEYECEYAYIRRAFFCVLSVLLSLSCNILLSCLRINILLHLFSSCYGVRSSTVRSVSLFSLQRSLVRCSARSPVLCLAFARLAYGHSFDPPVPLFIRSNSLEYNGFFHCRRPPLHHPQSHVFGSVPVV